MDLSQYLNGTNTNGTGNTLSIPGLENVQGLLGTITIISVVLGGLFAVLYVINTIQRIRADRATIAMHKDIAAIKELLILERSSTTFAQPTPQPNAPAESPSTPEAPQPQS